MKSKMTENERKLSEKLHAMERERKASPQVRGVLQWIRAQGYSLSSALLELLDNSLSAKAKRIRVCMYSEGTMLGRMVVIDDGSGMTLDELEDAFVVAGKPKDRAAGDIGKFRVGMKGAAWSQTKELTIVSWSPDGTGIVGLRANVESMANRDTFQPDEIGSVDEEWMRAHFVSKDVEAFMNAKKGTMIQINNFWLDCVQHCEDAVDKICKAIGSGYEFGEDDVQIERAVDDEPAETIETRDLFHRHDAEEALDFPPYETALGVYSVGAGKAYRIIEHVQMDRKFKTGRGLEVVQRGDYLEYKLTEKGKKAAASFERISADDVENLKNRLIELIPVRLIQVNAEVDADERKEFPNRKGFWFFRNNRCVGQGLTIGKKLHDRSTSYVEQQRMLVQASPKSDEVCGFKFNKQMEANNPLPSQILTDALYSLYKQVTSEWTKLSETPSSSPTPTPLLTFNSLSEISTPSVQADAHTRVEVPTVASTLVIQDGRVGDGQIWIEGHGAADGLLAWLTALQTANPAEYRRTLAFFAQ